jgi:hypothetical protein
MFNEAQPVIINKPPRAVAIAPARVARACHFEVVISHALGEIV